MTPTRRNSFRLFQLAGINVYLHWYELEKYREEGFTSYDFGSLGHLKDSVGVNRFKMQFGGTIIREHNYILAGMPGAWRTTSRLLSLLSSRWQRRVKMQRAGDRWRHMPLEKIRETMETSISDYQRSLQARPLASNHSSSRLTRVAADSDLPPEPGFENKHGKASERI